MAVWTWYSLCSEPGTSAKSMFHPDDQFSRECRKSQDVQRTRILNAQLDTGMVAWTEMDCNWRCQIRQYNTLFLASIMASATPAEMSMSMEVDGETSITRPSRPQSYSQGMRASSLPAFSRQYTVGYVYSPEMMIHYSPHGHPEDPNRITSIYEAIAAAGLVPEMKQLPIRPVKREESLLVHSEDHWDKVKDIQRE